MENQIKNVGEAIEIYVKSKNKQEALNEIKQKAVCGVYHRFLMHINSDEVANAILIAAYKKKSDILNSTKSIWLSELDILGDEAIEIIKNV